MNKVTLLILLASVLLLTACSETANSKSKQQVSSPTTSLGAAPEVEPKAIPAIVVEEPVQPVAAKPTPAVKSSFTMTAVEAKRFNKFDTNGDGGVTLSEYTEALRLHYERKGMDKNASKMASTRLKKLDLNGDESLNPEEFTPKRK